MEKIGKLFWLILAGAILLRIVLLYFTMPLPFSTNGDLTRYEDWAQIAHIYSLSDTYSGHHTKTVVNNEPPGSLYIISATYETYILAGKIIARVTHTQAGSILWVNTFLLHLWMKVPSIIAEILIGVAAYMIVAKKRDDRRGLLAFALIVFNPVLFYNSVLWGQMDSDINLFFMLSLLLAFMDKYFLSLLLFAISIYVKVSLLPLLPFYLVFMYFLSKKNIKLLGIGIVICMVLVVAATFPISHNPLLWLITNIPAMSKGEQQNITNAAFNFWWFITCGPTCQYPPVNSVTFLWVNLNTWGYLLFGVITLPLLYVQIKLPKVAVKKDYVFLIFSLVALAIFLFLPKMHDRYLYPFFPLFAVFIALTKQNKFYVVIYCALSFLHLLNLIYSWFPTYYPYFFIYQIVYSRIYDWIVSGAIVVASSVVYLKFYSQQFFLLRNKNHKVA